MSVPDELHVRKEMTGIHDLGNYAKGLTETMHLTWESVGKRIVDNVDDYNRRPRAQLQFKEYEPGQYFLLKRIPKRFFRQTRRGEPFRLVFKFQHRWTGPFRIMEKRSPILYEADVHGTRQMVHAINMKPYRTIQATK